MKYSNEKDIQEKYNRKLWQLNRWLNETLRQFRDGTNIKKRVTDPKKEDLRQSCMELEQVNCRMRAAIERDSKLISCCSCGDRKPRREMQGGHYISRAKKSTCLHPININPQCKKCNNPATKPKATDEMYKQFLISKYWQYEYNKLMLMAGAKGTFTVPPSYRETLWEEKKSENFFLKSEIKRMWLGEE